MNKMTTKEKGEVRKHLKAKGWAKGKYEDYLSMDLMIPLCSDCKKGLRFWREEFTTINNEDVCLPCAVKRERELLKAQDEAFKSKLSSEEIKSIEGFKLSELSEEQINKIKEILKETK